MTFGHVSSLRITIWCNKSHQIIQRKILNVKRVTRRQGAAYTSKVPLEPCSKLRCPRPFIKGSALKALNGDTGDYGVPAIKQLLGFDLSPNESRDSCLIDSFVHRFSGQVDGCSGYPLPRSWEVWSLWPGQRCWYVLMVGKSCLILGADCSWVVKSVTYNAPMPCLGQDYFYPTLLMCLLFVHPKFPKLAERSCNVGLKSLCFKTLHNLIQVSHVV